MVKVLYYFFIHIPWHVKFSYTLYIFMTDFQFIFYIFGEYKLGYFWIFQRKADEAPQVNDGYNTSPANDIQGLSDRRGVSFLRIPRDLCKFVLSASRFVTRQIGCRYWGYWYYRIFFMESLDKLDGVRLMFIFKISFK